MHEGRRVSWAAADGVEKVMVDVQIGDVGTAKPVDGAVERLRSILADKKRSNCDLKYENTSMSTIFYAPWETATQIIDEACYVSLTEATPKFAFNMRILAVKDGEHPLSHNIKEEPLPMVAEVVSRTTEDIEVLSDAAGDSSVGSMLCGDPSLAVMQTKLTHITIDELSESGSSHRTMDRQIGWFVNRIGEEIQSFEQEHHQEIFSFSVTTLAGPRQNLFEIWHKAMKTCFEKGVDGLGFSFQVHTTIDSKLCRPFRRFDRFYAGEKKMEPGQDTED